MATLNTISPPPKFDGDPFEVALKLLDRLFPFFPDYDAIDINSCIKKSNLSDSDKKIASYLIRKIELLLYSKLNYGDKTNPTNRYYHGCLNDLGRTVKSFGGHFAYLDELKQQQQLEEVRQNLSDKKLIHDLIISEFESGPGKKIKIRSYCIAVGTFLITLLVTFGITSWFQKNNEPNTKEIVYSNHSEVDSLKKELLKTQKEINQIKQQLEKMPKYKTL